VLLDLHRSEHANRQMAHHDLLTGLPNRAMNLELFAELLARPAPDAGSQRAKFAVFCLDLDGFKAVNDGLGHATGDAVLVAVAERLRASIRDVDSPAASAATNSSSCCLTSPTMRRSPSPGGLSPASPSRLTSHRMRVSASASASPRRLATA